MKNIAIKVQNLTKVYKLYDSTRDRLKEVLNPFKKKYHKEFYALKNVSFEIYKGETVGIVGKNGAGKSTILKIITGVLTPTSGHVHINGKIASLLELGAGFNPEYTGIENIYLQGLLIGYTREETDKKLDKILQFADIGDFVYQPVKSYSSGMFARLAFAIAINVEPDILIVDEALSVGDAVFQAKCMLAMERIKQKGATILFVSHDINSVRSLCERGIFLKNGVLHAIGKAGDVAELYMKESRDTMNQNLAHEYAEAETDNSAIKCNDNNIFKNPESFSKKVSHERYGSGEAKVTYVEVLDIDGYEVIEAKFNQEVTVKIYFEAYKDTNLAVGFGLFDDKRIQISGGNFASVGQKQISVTNGEKYCVSYKLKLPLQMNNYTIQTSIANELIKETNIAYYDVIPNAYTFTIARRENATLWAKVCLFPSLKIERL